MIHDKLVVAFGDEPKECASEAAANSKEGRRSANCPVQTKQEEPLCVFIHPSLSCASAPEQSLTFTLRADGWLRWEVSSGGVGWEWGVLVRVAVCVRRTPACHMTHRRFADTDGDVLKVLTETSRCVVVVTSACRCRSSRRRHSDMVCAVVMTTCCGVVLCSKQKHITHDTRRGCVNQGNMQVETLNLYVALVLSNFFPTIFQ